MRQEVNPMIEPPKDDADEDFLPLSGLQHLSFCERQWALIYLERCWRDNPLTLEGAYLHQRVHQDAPRRELRGDILVARQVRLHSRLLGVSGLADVVEFHRVRFNSESNNSIHGEAVPLPGLSGLWKPFPIEYKRGKPKPEPCDEVQLCAQAICLEEMLQVGVAKGALFYGSTHHRHEVAFLPALRQETARLARRAHELFSTQLVPKGKYQPKCGSCSLFEACRPDTIGGEKSASRYLRGAIRAALSTVEPEA